ncbi:apolipoprotein N-acyltransferase [Roseovarius tibetensis]|uniref:apolipoprotein N-acyltransferase n=1 Tax=Roseovarius tibetensis TaxID=2685897 RepID=UPI003D7F90DA
MRMALALVAGGLFVAAVPPLSLAPLALLSFATLYALVENQGIGRAFAIGWTFGLGQFVIGISWIGESFQVEAETFGALAIPAVGGLAAGLALFPALAALVYAGLMRLRLFAALPASAVFFAAAWAGTEWLRGHVLTGFPWNLAAYALTDLPVMRQPAAWVGSYGMGFLLVQTGAWLGAALIAQGRARAVSLGLTVALIGMVWVAGTWLAGRETRPESGTRLRIVQGNIPQAEKWAPGSRTRMLEKYLRLSTRPGDYDLLLWPETAFPGFVDEDAAARARIADSLPEGAYLLIGAPDRVQGQSGTRYFNTIQAYGQRGEILTGYAKHHLVPFGEYVPWRDWLPFRRMVESLGDFTPGPGPRTLALPGVPLFAPAICYEIIFPGHVTDRLFRPDWIFNATNDAWFGTSIGPEQHLAAARMRAVEEGLPVIRAANTGISAVIDARGAVIVRRELQADAVINATLPPALPRTPYARFRDWMLLALVAFVLGAAVALSAIARDIMSEKTEEN